ncbi:MAG TPA: type IV toxin-antitoxin system AbiEi family antitoxin domain-containing protein [Nocardioidaceae bacterium]|nr:type IV toxin-antitoxin system AbiEi family antitoxin domain-containing protein [Nocardioidaceae bacterium]
MDEILQHQAGVISRRQALEAGLEPHDIKRHLRQRHWATVHPGVYVNHTGPLTWLQRAWAAVLFSWPAALCGESALRAVEGPGRRGRDDRIVHVAVGRHRSRVVPPGVELHRMEHLGERALWNVGPPRLRYEEAVLDVAIGASTEFEAIAVLADAVQGRRTTAVRLRAALAGRPRASRRAWLDAVLEDVAAGTCSVLEHAYLVRVERGHGLPRGRRQSRGDGPVYRDVEYDGGLVVELDGRLFHDSARGRDRDFDRDLAAAVDGRDSVRLSWGQVYDRGCITAHRLGRLLQVRGWTGSVRACGPDCVGFGPPGSPDPTHSPR